MSGADLSVYKDRSNTTCSAFYSSPCFEEIPDFDPEIFYSKNAGSTASSRAKDRRVDVTGIRNMPGSSLEIGAGKTVQVKPYEFGQGLGRGLRLAWNKARTVIDYARQAESSIDSALYNIESTIYDGLWKAVDYAKSTWGSLKSSHSPETHQPENTVFVSNDKQASVDNAIIASDYPEIQQPEVVQTAQTSPFSPDEVVSIVNLFHPSDDLGVYSLKINGRHLIVVGEHHTEEYERFNNVFINCAGKSRLAFFHEGIPRDEYAERGIIDRSFGFKPPEGYFFGLENPKLFSIVYLSDNSSAFYTSYELSKVGINPPNKNIEEKQNTCSTIIMSLQTQELLHQIAKNSDVSLIRELDQLISRYATSEEGLFSRLPSFYEELSSLQSFDNLTQWIELCNLLTFAMMNDSNISDDRKYKITKLLNDPKGDQRYHEFNQALLLDARSDAFKDTILKTLQTLPADVTSVVFMGNCHIPRFLKVLEEDHYFHQDLRNVDPRQFESCYHQGNGKKIFENLSRIK